MVNQIPKIFEVFYNSSISAKFWQNPASIDGEEQNKKLPPVELNQEPLAHHGNALFTELSQHLVASLNYLGLCKVMLY